MAKCTTFEVLMAHVRRCREKASEMAPSEETKILFAVDGGNSFESPLLWKQERVFIFLVQRNIFGDKHLPFVAELVKKAVEMMMEKHTRFAIDYFKMNHVRPSIVATLVITTLNRLSFDTTDFGFGETQCRQRQQLFLKGNLCCCCVLARDTILYFSISSYREHTFKFF